MLKQGSALDRYFRITERGSNLSREIRGGFATFFAMSYIVVLNPLILRVADSNGDVLGVTAVAAVGFEEDRCGNSRLGRTGADSGFGR